MLVEKRTFVSNDDFDGILEHLQKIALKQDKEKQVIYTYHTEGNFRLIRTKEYIKLDLKSHDKSEDIVYVSKKYEGNLINMFFKLGMDIELKRYRTRYKFIVDDFYITLDYNVKSGNVLKIKIDKELEEKELEEKVNSFLESMNIHEMSLEKATELFTLYRTNWSDLTRDIEDEEFLRSKGNE